MSVVACITRRGGPEREQGGDPGEGVSQTPPPPAGGPYMAPRWWGVCNQNGDCNMTNSIKRTPSAKQLAVLAAGRAKAKANREAAPAPVALDFVQLPASPVETLDHAGARAKLRALGLQAAQLPGRGKAVKLGAWTITNAKGKFSFASDTPAKAAPAPELTREMVLAWLTNNGLKL